MSTIDGLGTILETGEHVSDFMLKNSHELELKVQRKFLRAANPKFSLFITGEEMAEELNRKATFHGFNYSTSRPLRRVLQTKISVMEEGIRLLKRGPRSML